jgi:hypothetical protein
MGIMQKIIAGMVQQEIEVVGKREIWIYKVGGAVRGVRLRKEFRIERWLKGERDIRNVIGIGKDQVPKWSCWRNTYMKLWRQKLWSIYVSTVTKI